MAQTAILIGEAIEKWPSLRSEKFISFISGESSYSLKRRFALLLLPFFLNFPWSGSLLLHPTQFLLEPGIPTPSGGRWEILFFNPGGTSAPPLWIFSPFFLFLIATLVIEQLRSYAVLASTAMGIALALSQVVVTGHGGNGKVWTGPLIALAMIILLSPLLRFVQDELPKLREKKVGSIHLSAALLALITAISLIVTPIWSMTAGANSLVRGNEAGVTPAFVTALTQTPARPKTIIIKATEGSTTYFITRGNDLQLGDPDSVIATPDAITHAMEDLIAGTGITSGKTIGRYGINYLVLTAPISPAIARTIDGIGGFIRMSSTASGIVWKVMGASPRVLFIGQNNVKQMIPSSDITASGDVPGAGTIIVAEKFDNDWHLLLDGLPIPVQENSDGLPTFKIPNSGHVELSHDGTRHRAMISLQLLLLLVSIVMALPGGRRRREVPVEELV